jgi:hypothetical protein
MTQNKWLQLKNLLVESKHILLYVYWGHWEHLVTRGEKAVLQTAMLQTLFCCRYNLTFCNHIVVCCRRHHLLPVEYRPCNFLRGQVKLSFLVLNNNAHSYKNIFLRMQPFLSFATWIIMSPFRTKGNILF